MTEKNYRVAFEQLESAEGYPNKSVVEITKFRKELFDAVDNDKQKAEKLAKDLSTVIDKNNKLISYFGFDQNRAWAYRNGKFAVIDADGKQLTDFVFTNPKPFRSDGWALVKKDTSEFFMYKDCKTFSEPFDWIFKTNAHTYKVRKGKNYTFVDSVGRQIKGWRSFSELSSFSDGLAAFRENGKIGFVNNAGDIKIQPQYDNAIIFTNGTSKVLKSPFWGLINVTGKEIFTPKYSSIGYFSKTKLAVSSIGLKQGLINEKGVEILANEYDGFGFFTKQGYATCTKNNKHGLVNPLGKVIIQPKYDRIGQVNTNGQILVALLKDSYYAMGIIDTLDNEILEFSTLRPLSNVGCFNLVAVGNGDNWGYLNIKTKKLDIPAIYKFADEFTENGLALVAQNGKAGFIDTTGKVVVPLKFDILLRFSNFNLAGFKQDGKAGFINTKGDVVIQPKYDFVNNFGDNGLAAVYIGSKWGFINIKGEYVIEPIFDNLTTSSEDPLVFNSNKHFVNDQIFVTIGAETFLINSKGEIIVK